MRTITYQFSNYFYANFDRERAILKVFDPEYGVDFTFYNVHSYKATEYTTSGFATFEITQHQ